MTSLKNKLPSVPIAANNQQLKINSQALSVIVGVFIMGGVIVIVIEGGGLMGWILAYY